MTSILKVRCHGCHQKLDLSDLTPFTRIPCPACEAPIIVPQPFGNLLLEEEIGTGELSRAFRAIDIALDREVCVKLLPRHLENDAEFGEQWVAAARDASGVTHPNLVPIYSCGEHDGELHIVMQFMHGGALGRLLPVGSKLPNVYEISTSLVEVTRGLDSAYISGIIHGDIRPANMLQDSESITKLTDFGLRRVYLRHRGFDEDSAGRNMYRSPEQLRDGSHEVAGEIFSLGASFYHLLTGTPAFRPGSRQEMIEARDTRKPPSARKLRRELPPELSNLLNAMLAPNPGDRPQSYAEVAGALNSALNEIPLPANSTQVQFQCPEIRSARKGDTAEAPVASPKTPVSVLPPTPVAGSPSPPATVDPKFERDRVQIIMYSIGGIALFILLLWVLGVF
jgi:serine/threonine protein kinase